MSDARVPTAAAVAPATRLAVLLFTDIVGSTELKSKLGTATYMCLLGRHNEMFEAGLRECNGAEMIKHTGDGYLAAFATASDAVRFALVFQSRMGLEPWEPRPLRTRVGIHVGEVALLDMAGRKDVVGLSADVAARIMSLAAGGQILLTASAFNDARQFVSRAPEVVQQTGPPLRWVAHGPYLFKGADDPLEVYEVGIEGVSPLSAPPDGEKARRVTPRDQEPTLGWRPAVSLEVPGRPRWILEKKLGDGGFGEVWLGVHEKLRQRRVFKFCFDADRLRSFKRELTLFRLLQEELGKRDDIATLYEFKLDEPPFFLESEYTEGGDLSEWSQRRGGIEKLPLAQRLELLAKVADAVAAAHSVAVLHKDIKPANILIQEEPDGRILPRLSDFGIGMVSDLSRLQAHAITQAGFTQLTRNESSRTGTRMYAPPESLLNKPFTTHGDVYALGVLTYQMAVGDLSRPLAPGWERDVADDVLREDIAAMVEGDSSRRLSSASEVAQRLRSLERRRIERRERLEQSARAARRARRQRVLAAALVSVLILGAAAAGLTWKYIADLRAEQARTARALADAAAQRDVAQQERDTAKASLNFLIALLGSADPANTQGREITVRELVERTASSDWSELKDKPLVEANIRNILAVTFNALGRADLALPHARVAESILTQAMGLDHPTTLAAVYVRAMILRALGRDAEALPLHERVMESYRRTRGEDDPNTISTEIAYAQTLEALGQPQRAEPLHKRALEGRRRVLGPQHHLTLEALSNYAGVLETLGRAAEAEPLYRQAIDGTRAALGPDHPVTLTLTGDYACLLGGIGRAAEAESISREVLQRRRKVQGEDHPDTLNSLHNLGEELRTLRRTQESSELFRQAYEGRRRVLGDDHPDTVASMCSYGSSLGALGRPQEAEPLCKRAMEGFIRVRGPEHPDTLTAASRYAGVLILLNRLDEAETLLRQDADVHRKLFGNSHPQTVVAIGNLAHVLDLLGRGPEAAILRRQAGLPEPATRPASNPTRAHPL